LLVHSMRQMLRRIKSLDPIPQFKASAKLGPFLELASASSD